jgi:hypothetical protein
MMQQLEFMSNTRKEEARVYQEQLAVLQATVTQQAKTYAEHVRVSAAQEETFREQLRNAAHALQQCQESHIAKNKELAYLRPLHGKRTTDKEPLL